MTPPRRIPRRPRSLACEKDDNLRRKEDIPPDPRASSPHNNDLIQERSVRCLLSDIDHIKLSSLLTGHPAGRGSALLLQALRQQVSVAASSDYTRQALDWIVDNDVLMLTNRKNSVLCRVLQADGVDSREEIARLINTIASYAKGRQYFAAYLRVFLPCVVAVLRGRRLPSSTHDQLIATIQKTSVRPSVQRELLQCGMLEWIVNLLEGKTTPYATEYGVALAINLSLNTASYSLQLRFADSLAAAACNILNRDIHGPSCSVFNSLVLVWLGCSRVRLRARETRLVDALRARISKRPCPLCDLHIPYLLAVITGDAEIVRVPQAPSDADADNVGDCCEREVDSTDPVRPTSNELSGARLLLRRAVREVSPEHHPTVPGQVLRHQAPLKTTHGPRRGRSSEPRLGTATSHHTFVIETERRKPLLLPVGLTEGAVEYKKIKDAAQRAKEEDMKRLDKDKIDKEAIEPKDRAKGSRLTTIKKPPNLRKTCSKESILAEKAVLKGRQNMRPYNKEKSSPLLKSPSSASSSTSPTNQLSAPLSFQGILDDSCELDYIAVFGARPKVARTPDGVGHRGLY